MRTFKEMAPPGPSTTLRINSVCRAIQSFGLSKQAPGLYLMVGVARLELTTPRSQSECATNCATPRQKCERNFDTFLVYLLSERFQVIFYDHPLKKAASQSFVSDK